MPLGPSGRASVGTSIGRPITGGVGCRFVVRPWSPVCHSVYPQSFRNTVVTVLMANAREDAVPSVVPPALWMEVRETLVGGDDGGGGGGVVTDAVVVIVVLVVIVSVPDVVLL